MAGEPVKKKSFIRSSASALVKFKQGLSIRTFYSLICLIRFVVPAKKNYWAFPVHFKQGAFSDNARPVFEAVKKDPELRKYIFTSGTNIQIEDAVNTHIINILTLKGLWHLAQCKVIFVQHSLLRDYKLQSYIYRHWLLRHSYIVNLWHGIAVKYIQYLDNTSVALDESGHYDLIISSSLADRLVMAASFFPVTLSNVQPTGLPRNDYLSKPIDELPSSYRQQLDYINKLKGNKKLILYAPTYREVKKGGNYYSFSSDEVNRLKELLEKQNAILGFRSHYYKNSKVDYSNLFDKEHFFNLNQEIIPDVNMILRSADLVITDYSSLYIDAMYCNKPVINFTYDLEHYSNTQRGLFYDFENVAPGQLCHTFGSLITAIGQSLEQGNTVSNRKYRLVQKMFFDTIDTGNTQRVLDHIKKELKST